MDVDLSKDRCEIQIDVLASDKMVNFKATESDSELSSQLRCVASLVILIVVLTISVIFLYAVVAKFLTEKNSQTAGDPIILSDSCTQSRCLISILKNCKKMIKENS